METVIFRGKTWRVEIQVYEAGLQPAISLIDPDDETALTATINVARSGLVYIQDWHFARTQEYTRDPTYNIIKALQMGEIIEEKFSDCVFKLGLSVRPVQGFKLKPYYQKIFDTKKDSTCGVEPLDNIVADD